MKRCRKWKSAAAMGLSYQIFLILRKIVDSNTRRSELVTDAKNWLQTRRPSTTGWMGVLELQQHWYYLRRSIENVLKVGVLGLPRRQLPYAIATEYWTLKTHPSPVDIAFAEEERLQT